MTELKVEMRCRVNKDYPGVCSKDTFITIEKNRDTGKVVRGKTGMIFCSLTGGGSIFVKEKDLIPV